MSSAEVAMPEYPKYQQLIGGTPMVDLSALLSAHARARGVQVLGKVGAAVLGQCYGSARVVLGQYYGTRGAGARQGRHCRTALAQYSSVAAAAGVSCAALARPVGSGAVSPSPLLRGGLPCMPRQHATALRC